MQMEINQSINPSTLILIATSQVQVQVQVQVPVQLYVYKYVPFSTAEVVGYMCACMYVQDGHVDVEGGRLMMGM